MRRSEQTSRDKKYDGFISYNQKADKDLAPALRDGLQRMAKPWNRRRALNIFLDQSSLELDHELGAALDRRIDDTRWLIVLMSERSAKSDWVGAELREWAETRSKETMALVLTSGKIEWDDAAKDFDYAASTAVNPALRGVFTGQESEPLYLDLTWTKKKFAGREKELDLDHAEFRSAVATVAAPIHGKSKDEIEGDDLRQHKRFVRIRRAAVASLCVLTVAAVVGAVLALMARSDAIEQRQRAASRAIAGDALNTVEVETDLSALLALESVRVKNTTDARGGLVSLLSEPTRFLQRTDVHDAPVSAIAFDPSGRVAVTGDESGVLRVWDVDPDPLAMEQATPRPEPIAIGEEIAEVRVGDDEGTLFVVVTDAAGGLTFVELDRPDELDVLLPPDELGEDGFWNAAVSTEGGLVAGATYDGTVVVYRLPFSTESEEFEEVLWWEDGVGPAFEGFDPPQFAFNSDGSQVVWSNWAGFAVWRQGSDPVSFDDAFTTDVTSLAVSPDDAVIVVGEDNGLIHLYDAGDLSLTELADPPPVNLVFDLAFKPEVDESGAMTLASAHSDGDVMLWTVLPGEGFLPFALLDEVLLGHRDEARVVAFAPDGRIASADFEGEVIWWNDEALSVLGRTIPVPDDGPDIAEDDNGGDDADVLDVAVVAPGVDIALDGRGRLWSTDADRSSFTPFATTDDSVPASALHGAAGVIAVGRLDGSTEIYRAADVATGPSARPEWVLPGDGKVEAVAVAADGSRVLTANAAGARLWDAASGSPIVDVSPPAGFEPNVVLVDVEQMWVGGQDAEGFPAVLAVDPATGDIVDEVRHSEREGNAVTALELSGDGAVLASGSGDRSIKLWDAADLGDRGGSFVGHRGTITGIVFWDDGETLISSDDAGAVLMWDVSERQEFAELGGPGDGVRGLDVDPANALLIGAGEEGVAWTWTLDQGLWREGACQLAGRNMTVDEWERYGTAGTRVRHCPGYAADDEGATTDASYTDQLTD